MSFVSSPIFDHWRGLHLNFPKCGIIYERTEKLEWRLGLVELSNETKTIWININKYTKILLINNCSFREFWINWFEWMQNSYSPSSSNYQIAREKTAATGQTISSPLCSVLTLKAHMNRHITRRAASSGNSNWFHIFSLVSADSLSHRFSFSLLPCIFSQLLSIGYGIFVCVKCSGQKNKFRSYVNQTIN